MDGMNYFPSTADGVQQERVEQWRVMRTAALMTVAVAVLTIAFAVGLSTVGYAPTMLDEFTALPLSP